MTVALLVVSALVAGSPSDEASVMPSTTSTSSSTSRQPSPEEQARFPLAEAEAALRAGVHRKCVELAQQALATGRLDTDDVARAWLVRGRCHAIDGDPDRAERSYAAAVRVKPDILLPTDDAVFARVRPEGTNPTSALTLTAHSVVVAGGDVVVAVSVAAQDDLGLGRVFVLVNDDDREVARAPIERAPDAVGDAFVRPVHRFSGIPVEGLRARLLDRHGNRIREAAVVVDDEARAALVAAGATPSMSSSSAPSSSWVSWLGAGTVAAGFVLAGAGGVAFATAAQADPARLKDDEGGAFATFVLGTTLFVVGGAVVVVDQWPH